MEEREADVCVVGGGYSGLAAAWRLSQAGRRVVGRVWTEPRAAEILAAS